MTTSLTPDQAHEIAFVLALLSLDLSAGTLAPMGLEVPDEEVFRAALHAEDLGPASGDEGAARVSRTLKALETKFGASFVARLLDWTYGFFLTTPDPQVFLWRCVVGACRGGDAPPLVQRIRDDIFNLRRELPSTPRSSRDIELLTAYGFPSLQTEDGMAPGPMNLIEEHLEDAAFLGAWDRALARSRSPDAEIDAMFTWGKGVAARSGLRSLARPGTFRRWSPGAG